MTTNIKDILKEGHRYLYHRLDGKLVLTDETELKERIRVEVEAIKINNSKILK